jgi:ABC-type Na+ efflux pump permease subunit
MLSNAWYLARKDLRYLFRGWETWFWGFGMPVLFFYFIGTVTGGSSRPADPEEWIGVHIEQDAGFLAEQFCRRLENQGYRLDRVDRNTLEYHERRLIVPAGLTRSVLAGEPARVEFRRVGGGLEADYDEIRVKRAAYAVLADLVVVGARRGEPTPEALSGLAAEPRRITLDVTAAGERRRPPSGFQQSVPGTMVMFTLLVLFTTGGVSIFQERQQGILRRLASAPMSRGAVVAGKWASRFILGVVQIGWAMTVGTILFPVDWGPHVWALVLVMLGYAALAAAAGIMLGNFGRTEGMVIGMGVILSNVLAALGGCWWPSEITPLWAQRLTMVLPTGWAMDALHKLMSFGADPAMVFPHMLAMAGGAAIAGWVMARSFRFQ